ncbi:MAG: hypothetical protein ACE5NN_00630, partial [Candidatus Bathyarchaeia archaeon]
LSAFIYPRLFGSILEIAHQFSKDRVVAILEGGYKLSFLKKIVAAIVAQMAGLNYEISDERPPLNSKIRKVAKKMIDDVKRTQSSFWSL